MNNPPAASSLISTSAIDKAMEILLEDLESKREEWDIVDQTSTKPTTSAQLDRRIKRLELALSAFQYQIRHEIANIRDQRNAMIAPIHRIPAELLQYIFLLRVSDHHALLSTSKIHDEYLIHGIDSVGKPRVDWSWRRINTYHRIFSMITTCSRWYQLGLSMPQLWSSLDSRDCQDLTQAALERSKHVPLDIWFLGDAKKPEQENIFMKLISPHLYCWRSLVIGSKAFALPDDLDIEGCSAPLLERFITHPGSVPKLPQMFLLRSPILRDLHLGKLNNRLTLHGLSGCINLSLNNRQGLSGITGEQLEWILSSSPLLETIFLAGLFMYQSDSLTPFSVVLPNIKSVTLSMMNIEVITVLLSSIFTNKNNHVHIKISEIYTDVRPQANIIITPPNGYGSLIDIARRNITWVLHSFSPVYQGLWSIKAGKEQLGVKSILLDIPHRLFLPLLYADTTSSPLHLNGKLKVTSMEIGLTNYGSVPMIRELHLYPYLEHLTISIHEYGRADIQSVMQDICFPLNGNNPHGSFLPQLKSFTLKNLKRLSILDELIKARYGPLQVDLMDSPSFRELVVFSVQFLDPIEEGLMTELESYFCSRKVKFDVVQDRSHNAVNL